MDGAAAFCQACGTTDAGGSTTAPVASAGSGGFSSGPSASGSSLDLGKVLGDTFDSYKSDAGIHMLATLVTSLLSGASFSLLSGTMQVGYMRMMDKRARGEPIELGDVFKGFDTFATSLALMILWGILLTIGFMLCIVPGLLVAPLGPVALYLIAQGETNPVAALQRAWGYVQPQLLMAVLGVILLAVIGSIGAIACYVGIFLTLPVLYIGGYHLARQLVGAGESPRA